MMRGGVLAAGYRLPLRYSLSKRKATFPCRLRHRLKMSSSSNNEANVAKMRKILKENHPWDKCWSDQITPWDLGKVTPIVADLVQRNDLPTGRALVPGCGSGYDVVALASPARHVIGLDISPTAIKQAHKVFKETDLSFVDFVCVDFFSYKPPFCFSLILDYTFFCALEPNLRPCWASKMAELLSDYGELITIIFPVRDAAQVDDHEDGPPYAVSLEAYERVLHPHGFRCVHFKENDLAVGGRKGREFIGRWKRIVTKL